jgi:hypothetical protein
MVRERSGNTPCDRASRSWQSFTLTSLSGFRIGVLANRLIKNAVVVHIGNHGPEEGHRRQPLITARLPR